MSSLAEVTLRGVRATDLGVLRPWLLAAGLLEPGVGGDQRWLARWQADPCIVCRTAEAPTGSVQGFLRLDLAPDRSAEVTLVVDPARRRNGIGRVLLAMGLAEARRRGAVRAVAVVAPTNSAAVGLFAAAGFRAGAPAPRGFLVLDRALELGADPR